MVEYAPYPKIKTNEGQGIEIKELAKQFNEDMTARLPRHLPHIARDIPGFEFNKATLAVGAAIGIQIATMYLRRLHLNGKMEEYSRKTIYSSELDELWEAMFVYFVEDDKDEEVS